MYQLLRGFPFLVIRRISPCSVQRLTCFPVSINSISRDMMFCSRVVPFPGWSHLDTSFTQVIVRMIKTVILNSFGVFVKQGFHQTGSSPRIVSLKFRLAEIPPYQLYLILVDQFIEDREQVFFVFFVVTEMTFSLFLSFIVSGRIGDTRSAGIIIRMIPVQQRHIITGFHVILLTCLGILPGDINSFQIHHIKIIFGSIEHIESLVMSACQYSVGTACFLGQFDPLFSHTALWIEAGKSFFLISIKIGARLHLNPFHTSFIFFPLEFSCKS